VKSGHRASASRQLCSRLIFIKGERTDEARVAARRQLMRHHCRHRRTVVTPMGRVVAFEVGVAGWRVRGAAVGERWPGPGYSYFWW
jgi:hypothetical protein